MGVSCCDYVIKSFFGRGYFSYPLWNLHNLSKQVIVYKFDPLQYSEVIVKTRKTIFHFTDENVNNLCPTSPASGGVTRNDLTLGSYLTTILNIV